MFSNKKERHVDLAKEIYRIRMQNRGNSMGVRLRDRVRKRRLDSEEASSAISNLLSSSQQSASAASRASRTRTAFNEPLEQQSEYKSETQIPNPQIPNPYCYEIDLGFLDMCTPEHPLIKGAFKQEFWSSPIDFDIFVEENIWYLLHFLNQCACARCTCR